MKLIVVVVAAAVHGGVGRDVSHPQKVRPSLQASSVPRFPVRKTVRKVIQQLFKWEAAGARSARKGVDQEKVKNLMGQIIATEKLPSLLEHYKENARNVITTFNAFIKTCPINNEKGQKVDQVNDLKDLQQAADEAKFNYGFGQNKCDKDSFKKLEEEWKNLPKKVDKDETGDANADDKLVGRGVNVAKGNAKAFDLSNSIKDFCAEYSWEIKDICTITHGDSRKWSRDCPQQLLFAHSISTKIDEILKCFGLFEREIILSDDNLKYMFTQWANRANTLRFGADYNSRCDLWNLGMGLKEEMEKMKTQGIERLLRNYDRHYGKN